MIYLTESNFASELRKICDSAKERIWISSPFVGEWNDIIRILGPKFEDESIDRRLLFDAVAGSMSKNTLETLALNNIQLKSLLSLHAKLYIIDNNVILSSANITNNAFTKRYEIGVSLQGNDCDETIKAFLNWWDMANTVGANDFTNVITTNHNFTVLNDLPPINNSTEENPSNNGYRPLKSGEYRINCVHLGIGTNSRCQYIAFACQTSDDMLESNSLVIMYDKDLIDIYEKLLNSKGVKSLGWEECQNLPENLKYLYPMKEFVFPLDKQHVRLYIPCISPETSGPGKIENYNGWEYDIGITQDPSIGMGLFWWEEKKIQEAWLKYPFSADAYPVIHTYVEVHVFDNPEKCTEINIESLKNKILGDFYRVYNEDVFKIMPNRDYNP